MAGSVHAESTPEKNEFGSFFAFKSYGNSLLASVENEWKREERSWAFRRHETVESSILREGEGDCGLPSVEGKVFGLDRKHKPYRAIMGGSSDRNMIKG